jgi:alkanesulfonate monooxygenase SsuD/methylene tetrahydromethanopterin reductase-like flavin-dependent oxidoreductase (luciferase family)
MTVRSALWLPLFDELADPAVVARLAADAEGAGWDGLFVWDHIHWRAPVRAVADPWITLAAVAAVTTHLRFGPMVTPLARRRPVKVARETATLDRLGGGRLVLGVGLGSDRFAGEYRRTAEPVDDRVRAGLLDESLAVLRAAWRGDVVHHRGDHFLVDGIAFQPTPVRGTVPVWVAAFPGSDRPLRRAARHDGFFPVNLDSPDQLAEAVATTRGWRTDPDEPFEVAAAVEPGTDPVPYVAAGATWILTDFDPAELRLDTVRGVLRAGPVG